MENSQFLLNLVFKVQKDKIISISCSYLHVCILIFLPGLQLANLLEHNFLKEQIL
jgi:hypothetical protein